MKVPFIKDNIAFKVSQPIALYLKHNIFPPAYIRNWIPHQISLISSEQLKEVNKITTAAIFHKAEAQEQTENYILT